MIVRLFLCVYMIHKTKTDDTSYEDADARDDVKSTTLQLVHLFIIHIHRIHSRLLLFGVFFFVVVVLFVLKSFCFLLSSYAHTHRVYHVRKLYID